ncbi:MAG: flagellar biosynthesis anti-sigma factor FlgM [Oscillospiraceae bacterium]|nr:flagellar biosynthesis anti-sigma factor FlgM [Oscillospiraceae bacterium]
MVIQGSAGIVSAAGLGRAYPAAQVSAPAAAGARESLTRRFDSVTISARGGGQNVRSSLKSALSQELRATMGTESLDALREEIRSGAYQPDPMETAKRILLRA